MTTYIATPTEAAALHAGTQTAIVVPVKPQPVYEPIIITCDKCGVLHEDVGEWFEKAHKTHLCLSCGNLFRPKDTPTTGIKPPYQVGDVIAIREAWAYCIWDNKTKYYYRDDPEFIAELEFLNRYEDDWKLKFNSPATMPRSAVRTLQEVVAVECVRVRDMTEEQAEKLLQFDYSEGKQYKNYTEGRVYHDSSYCFGDYRDSLESYIIAKHGHQAWDDNIYVFVNTVKKHSK